MRLISKTDSYADSILALLSAYQEYLLNEPDVIRNTYSRSIEIGLQLSMSRLHYHQTYLEEQLGRFLLIHWEQLQYSVISSQEMRVGAINVLSFKKRARIPDLILYLFVASE